MQAIFDAIPTDERPKNPKLVVSGDGRYGNVKAVQTIAEIAVANGVRHLIIGQHG